MAFGAGFWVYLLAVLASTSSTLSLFEAGDADEDYSEMGYVEPLPVVTPLDEPWNHDKKHNDKKGSGWDLTFEYDEDSDEDAAIGGYFDTDTENSYEKFNIGNDNHQGTRRNFKKKGYINGYSKKGYNNNNAHSRNKGYNNNNANHKGTSSFRSTKNRRSFRSKNIFGRRNKFGSGYGTPNKLTKATSFVNEFGVSDFNKDKYNVDGSKYGGSNYGNSKNRHSSYGKSRRDASNLGTSNFVGDFNGKSNFGNLNKGSSGFGSSNKDSAFGQLYYNPKGVNSAYGTFTNNFDPFGSTRSSSAKSFTKDSGSNVGFQSSNPGFISSSNAGSFPRRKEHGGASSTGNGYSVSLSTGRGHGGFSPGENSFGSYFGGNDHGQSNGYGSSTGYGNSGSDYGGNNHHRDNNYNGGYNDDHDNYDSNNSFNWDNTYGNGNNHDSNNYDNNYHGNNYGNNRYGNNDNYGSSNYGSNAHGKSNNGDFPSAFGNFGNFQNNGLPEVDPLSLIIENQDTGDAKKDFEEEPLDNFSHFKPGGGSGPSMAAGNQHNGQRGNRYGGHNNDGNSFGNSQNYGGSGNYGNQPFDSYFDNSQMPGAFGGQYGRYGSSNQMGKPGSSNGGNNNNNGGNFFHNGQNYNNNGNYGNKRNHGNNQFGSGSGGNQMPGGFPSQSGGSSSRLGLNQNTKQNNRRNRGFSNNNYNRNVNNNNNYNNNGNNNHRYNNAHGGMQGNMMQGGVHGGVQGGIQGGMHGSMQGGNQAITQGNGGMQQQATAQGDSAYEVQSDGQAGEVMSDLGGLTYDVDGYEW